MIIFKKIQVPTQNMHNTNFELVINKVMLNLYLIYS
jgi:hypothetical protein